MNGAESLIRTLVAGGVDTCFTNPGTSEMHLVAAFDSASQIRCVLALFEGVVSGAADGYARMARKPACTLLHLGPGLANALANMHNAARAHSSMVNLVGQHARNHLQWDTPLQSDIEGIARPYSQWIRTSATAAALGADTSDAILAARTAPGKIATLVVPADAAWNEGGIVGEIAAPPAPLAPDNKVIERASVMLRSGSPTALLLSGAALHGRGLLAAGRIAGATGAKLLSPYPFVRLEQGAGRPVVERIAYGYEQAVEQLKQIRQLILVGAPVPRSYFAHPTKNSSPVPSECQIHTLGGPSEELVVALETLASVLSAREEHASVQKWDRPAMPNGPITIAGIAASLAATLPEDAIVVDESMTSGRGIVAALRGCAPHDVLANTGGSIGIAMPLATGAAVACPGRQVLCLSADGSGMYTAQALWTMARENLDIITVVFSNRAYAVLKREYSNLIGGEPGRRASSLFEIGNPDLDWISLARGMGVPGSQPADLAQLNESLRKSFSTAGPSLIQVNL